MGDAHDFLTPRSKLLVFVGRFFAHWNGAYPRACMHTYASTHAQAHIKAHACTHKNSCMQTHKNSRMYTYTHSHIRTLENTQTHKNIFIDTHTYTPICVCVFCMYVCRYVWIHISMGNKHIRMYIYPNVQSSYEIQKGINITLENHKKKKYLACRIVTRWLITLIRS